MSRSARSLVLLALLVVSGGLIHGISRTFAQTNPLLQTLDRLQFLASVSQSGGSISDAEKEALQKQIDERNKQLEGIERELETARKALGTTQTQRQSLQGEVSRLEGSIKQLQLGIRQDEVTIQKLGFEITGLSSDVKTLQQRMREKQGTIGVLMRMMQKNDKTSPLIELLESRTLAEGFRDAQALGLLQEKLTNDIGELRGIHGQVIDKIEVTGEKQEQIEERQRNLENRKSIVEDQKQSRATVLQATKNQESIYQQQVSALQAQQQKIAQEVEAIDAALRGKINTNVLPNTGSGVLGVPVQGGLSSLTQGYGNTAFAKNGYRGQRHNGIDIGIPVGTPLYSAEAGTIVAVGNQDAFCPRGAYGRFIVIGHKNGLTTMYAHLSKPVVTQGQSVERGELIGYSGVTGYATGPHLHFTVYAQSTFYMGPSRVCGPMPFGGDLNPMNYL